MEKFKVDYSDSSNFKGIKILFQHLEEGLDFAYHNGIKDVAVDTNDIDSNRIVNFDFLKNKSFIETFHWLVPLSKKSDISGLYYLSKLKNFRWWTGKNIFPLDLSKLSSLNVLNIGYDKEIIGWGNLKQLDRLLISNVKTQNLSFLENNISLKYLRIIGGKFTSIDGIENCKELNTLFLQRCTSLIDLKKTLNMLPNLNQLNLERCKKVNVKEQLEGVKIKNISII